MRPIEVGDRTVLDYPPKNDILDFWPAWRDGEWEPETRRIIAEYATDRKFVDIGAWVGPTVLWAEEAGASSIRAYEPDPVAFGVLYANVALNGIEAELHHKAVTPTGAPMALRSDDFGESMSNADDGEWSIPVGAVSVEKACAGAGFVKVDVEGAEYFLLPLLAKVGCPMLVSVHMSWWPDPNVDMSGWGSFKFVTEHEGGFGELLCLP